MVNRTDKQGNESSDSKKPFQAADTGNASNPSPHQHTGSDHQNQLLSEKAEKYLGESGNIEDLPDPQEDWEAEQELDHPK